MLQRINLKQWLVVLSIGATLAVNGVATSGIFNGLTPQEISDSLMTKITPANYAFGVWGLIYMFVIGFTLFQALPSQRDNAVFVKIRELVIASGIFNIVWTLVWHYGYYALSVVFMVAILLTMIGIYSRAEIGRPTDSWIKRILVDLPFSLYMSWIAVATIVNIASVLVFYGWDGFGIAETSWSAIMIFVASIVGVALLSQRANFAYAAVFAWAVYAIVQRYPSESLITTVSFICIGIVVGASLVGWRRFGSLSLA